MSDIDELFNDIPDDWGITRRGHGWIIWEPLSYTQRITRHIRRNKRIISYSIIVLYNTLILLLWLYTL